MIYTLKNDKIEFSVSSLGAEPISIKTMDKTEYLWDADPKYFGAHGFHIFPWVGRLYQEQYKYGGETYPLMIHGFLRESEMTLKSESTDSLTLYFDSDEKTMKNYPFKFRFLVHYRLKGYAVEITFEVENRDDKTMYFAVGGHPGFMVPLEKGLQFDDYYLEFSAECAPKRTEPTETALLNGNFPDYPLREKRYLDLRHNLFDDDAIVLKDMARGVTLKSDKNPRAVRVDFPDCKYLGIWHTNKTEAPFVCIEPWTALQGHENTVEELETNKDMIALKEGGVYKNVWTITVYE